MELVTTEDETAVSPSSVEVGCVWVSLEDSSSLGRDSCSGELMTTRRNAGVLSSAFGEDDELSDVESIFALLEWRV